MNQFLAAPGGGLGRIVKERLTANIVNPRHATLEEDVV
jgi:hypothetical protein